MLSSPHSHSSNRATRFLLKGGAMVLITSTLLSFGNASALAGGSEVKALNNALATVAPGKTLGTATSQELLNAATVVLADPKFATTKKQGVVVGEALKSAGPFATDAGEVFGAAIVAAQNDNTSPLMSIFADRRNFISLAAKTAGKGKGLNVIQIPGLSAEVFVNEQSSTFITSAIDAKSKPGAGAILGGRARQFAESDPDPLGSSVVLANSALFEKKLQKGAQDIARYIGAEVDDTSSFAVQVADGNSSANSKYTVAIAIGTAAGDPTNAGNIAHALFNQMLLNSDGTLSSPPVAPSANVVTAAFKGVTTLAKSMSAMADIEEIQKIGNAMGQGIQNGQIKLSKAGVLTKSLVKSVMNKPATDQFGTAIPQNVSFNKGDEISEVAAYMVGGLIGSSELNALIGKKAKKGASKLLGIITAATKVKPSKKIGGPAPATFATDVALSVALTVLNAPVGSGPGQIAQDVKDAFEILMRDAKTGKKIEKSTANVITASLNLLYTNDPSLDRTTIENGLDPLGALSDPETDIHPFF